MNHLVAVACLLLLGGCDKERPRPVQSEPKPPVDAAPQPPPAECIVKLAITGDKLEYDGGGLKGALPKSAPDLSALKPVVGKCSVRITATDTTLYQDVLVVVEAVHRIGLQGSIGDGPRTTPRRSPSVRPPDAPDLPIGPDAVGGVTPVISIRVDMSDVTIQGRSIGTSPHGAGLAAAIQAELSKGTQPIDPSVILELDPKLPFSAVRQVIHAVEAAGYTKLAFSMRPQSRD